MSSWRDVQEAGKLAMEECKVWVSERVVVVGADETMVKVQGEAVCRVCEAAREK